MLIALLIIFVVSIIIQLYLHFILFKKHKITNDNLALDLSVYPEVTILICAKNEAHNISNNLPLVLGQDYPKEKFTVLVVNDCSDDNTATVLNGLQHQNSHLRIVTIDHKEQRLLKGKKHALHKGMETITTDWVLLTDADCRPASSRWLQLMIAKSMANDKAVILGYGGYHSGNGLLNKFIRFETVHTFIQYACMAAKDKAYMGVGRNLLYPVKYYFQAVNNKKFSDIYQLTPSGDDDLLVSFFSKNNKKIIAYGHQLAQTISTPANDFSDWLKQKKRHISTGKLYNSNAKFLLGAYAFSHLLFWLSSLVLFIWLLLLGVNKNMAYIHCLGYCSIKVLVITIPLLFIIRMYFYYKTFAQYCRILNEKKLRLWYPLLDFFWAFYNILLSPFIFLKSKQTWK